MPACTYKKSLTVLPQDQLLPEGDDGSPLRSRIVDTCLRPVSPSGCREEMKEFLCRIVIPVQWVGKISAQAMRMNTLIIRQRLRCSFACKNPVSLPGSNRWYGGDTNY